MEKEIGYATQAGLNYWAFVDYGDDPDLTIALRRYRATKDKRGLRYCLVEEGHRIDGHGTNYWPRLIEHFKDPNYQTVLEGRPLLYIFLRTEKLGNKEWRELSDRAVAAGLKRPYVVLMGGRKPEKDFKEIKALGFDAVSAYSGRGNYTMNPPTYAETCEGIRRDRWEKCRELNSERHFCYCGMGYASAQRASAAVGDFGWSWHAGQYSARAAKVFNGRDHGHTRRTHSAFARSRGMDSGESRHQSKPDNYYLRMERER